MILITTGKGGVGKTTLSAATAIAYARRGLRTVVVSVDPAHSLADVLDCSLGPEPSPLAPHLDAFEVRLSSELKTHWGTIQQYLARLLKSQGVQEWLAEDVAFLPGLEEIAGLLKLRALAEDYDRVVVDCPPTGHTLRYLNLPEAVHWYMTKFFPLERRIVQAVGPIAERLVGVPMPSGAVLDQVEGLFEEILELRNILSDPTRTVAQVVTTSESVVLRETERAIGYMHLHGVAVGRVILNRTEADAAATVAARFAPIDVQSVAPRAAEPIGLDALGELAHEVFGDADPGPRGEVAEPMVFEQHAGGAVVHLRVRRLTDDRVELRVGRRGDDLLVDFGPARRHLPLPPAIARFELKAARWVSDGIRLEFGV